MLHIVNKSHRQTTSLQSCLRLAQDGHALLLIEDGVYAVTRGGAASAGMAAQMIDGVTAVDYGGFVDLVAEYPNCQSWL